MSQAPEPSVEQLEVRAKLLERLKEDPFAYSFVGEGLSLLLDLSARFPEYLPPNVSIAIFSAWVEKTADRLPELSQNPDVFNQGLRRFALRQVKKLCDNCTRCSLHVNRLPNRGSAFGDGDVKADLMIVGEGPGAYEARGVTPFVSSEELRGSTCASECLHFERCYIDPNTQTFVREPTHSCTFEKGEIPTDQLRYRLSRRNQLNTAGEQLVLSLRKNGRFLRQSYVKVLQMQENLGMVPTGSSRNLRTNTFVTNALRCRCMKPDASSGRMNNAAPSVEEISACRPWLEITMALVNPKRLLLLGNPALKAANAELPPNFKITDACGSEKPNSMIVTAMGRRPAYVGLHPAYIMRMENVTLQSLAYAKLGRTIAQIAQDLQQEGIEDRRLNAMTEGVATTAA